MLEVNKRQNGHAVLPECVGCGSAAAFLWHFCSDCSPKGRAKGLYTYRASKSTLVSRNSALPRKASKGNRARFLFGGSRVEVFRRRGKRNPRLLNDSLVTFCSHRKSPHGVAGSETLLKGSPSTPAPGRTPAPTPFIYTYAACIPTA